MDALERGILNVMEFLQSMGKALGEEKQKLDDQASDTVDETKED